MRLLIRILPLLATALLLLDSVPRPTGASGTQPNGVSYWGMNAYITKRERRGVDNLDVLADTARNAGAQWTREELPWSLIEQQPGNYLTVYDDSLKLTADKGFGIIGELLTTPDWARDPSCVTNYWCPPADVNRYAAWARWMVDRYNGDGINDAPGSPRIAAWEIWNEPNDTASWLDIPPDSNARKLRYGQMLVAAYQAIKSVDPTAIVLTGGTYIYDGSCAGGVCDGLNFFNAAGGVFQQLPAAKTAFDVFAIHPYIPTDRPDAPQIPPKITVEGRIQSTRTWLNHDIGRPDAPVWITEIGWCTTGGACPGGVAVTEDAQADYLTRSMVIAQQNGVQHTSWFQLEDAFNDPTRLWSYAAIVHDDDGTGYPPKPAYNAYSTLAKTLNGFSPTGTGPVNTHVFAPAADQGDNGVYDYRYTGGTTTIDVIWIPTGTASVKFPVDSSKQIVLVDRDGGTTTVTPSGGTVGLSVSERPQFVVQQPPAAPSHLVVTPTTLGFVVQTGSQPVCSGIQITNGGGGTLTWTATTSTSWLTIQSSSGTAPGTFTLCATPGTTTGTQSGNVQIAGSDGSTANVAVSLIVASRVYKTLLPFVER
ncbi:MAG: cellulase family glycosylhydrolase [Herpetosiphonaceae bacterium]|nr:cellulase family glycosylhydrolase [Herpetosiphonaceae bacterium]